ncbi:BON domain-containing protein [Xenorhabdus innexi]|uniref:Osmotically inducible protein Y n=1 Tax=Xenorhabdus innexi TaxID=290109 RepID=A0A1N6N1N9_9GAMM|nr:BON domain-containing protein [Xenorhabdus innexi]PHM37208.1 osmotically inducible protein Y [Xenorhabdus innexi]SIP75011.1 Osmotically inducible protein Y [Xenorhabdus innexi]
MKNSKFTHSFLAVVLGSVLIGGNALAAGTSSDSLSEGKTLKNTDQKIDDSINHTGGKTGNSLKKADGYFDDSVITARIKENFLEDIGINSDDNNISVKTENGVVYLSGFVKNEELTKRAIRLAHKADGVQSVNSTLKIKK